MTQNKDAPYLKSNASKDNKMLIFIQYILHLCKKGNMIVRDTLKEKKVISLE